MVTPVLEQSSSFGSDLPRSRIGQTTPVIDVFADAIDGIGGRVLLVLGGEPLALVDDQFLLTGYFLLLFRLWNGRDEVNRTPGVNHPLGGLTLLVEFPMFRRVVVRRVEDGVLEEGIGHGIR
jgi:hypothetical protein